MQVLKINQFVAKVDWMRQTFKTIVKKTSVLPGGKKTL
jgi:hypothetical protein